MTGPIIESPWLTVPDAVDYTKYSKVVILAALKSGELKGSQIRAGGHWRIRRDRLDAWLEGVDPDGYSADVPRLTRRRG